VKVPFFPSTYEINSVIPKKESLISHSKGVAFIAFLFNMLQFRVWLSVGGNLVGPKTRLPNKRLY